MLALCHACACVLWWQSGVAVGVAGNGFPHFFIPTQMVL